MTSPPSGARMVDTLAELAAARDEARAVMAELHGLIKDAKQERAAIKESLQGGATMLTLTAIKMSLDRELPPMVDKVRRYFECLENRFGARWDDSLARINALITDLSRLSDRLESRA